MAMGIGHRHAGHDRDLIFANEELAVLEPTRESYRRGIWMQLHILHIEGCVETGLAAAVQVPRGHAEGLRAVQPQAARLNLRDVEIGFPEHGHADHAGLSRCYGFAGASGTDHNFHRSGRVELMFFFSLY